MELRTSSGRTAKAKASVFSLAAATAENLGGVGGIGFRVVSDADMAKAVERGFSIKAIDALRKRGMTDKEIGALIIKPRTLSHRREKRQKLTAEESDRAARVARVKALTRKTFGNEDKANRWLHKSLNSLEGRRPIDLVNTAVGARVVEDILTRIAWGASA
jgi:putative toxin-antitoxin system antitoxin component (TIGR02293 family)